MKFFRIGHFVIKTVCEEYFSYNKILQKYNHFLNLKYKYF